jgi:hypothetical protein
VSTLLDRLQDGRRHPITQAEYDHFLDVLPPVCMVTSYLGERWDFGFAEGADHVCLFRKRGNDCFAIKTPYLNPFEAGGFDLQKRRWILNWIELAKGNHAFRQAGSPRINTQTFHEYATDSELLADIQRTGWRAGSALFVGNICFVRLNEETEEWLAIKGGMVLGKTSFRWLVEAAGIEGAQSYLDSLRADPVGESVSLGRTRRSHRMSHTESLEQEPRSGDGRARG